MQNIFKILDQEVFTAAKKAGQFKGAGIDLADGFIHFSDKTQVQETAAKHFARRVGLVIFAVDADTLGPNLRWEASRGGALFPHLYEPLDMKQVLWAKPLPWNGERHEFPPETFI